MDAVVCIATPRVPVVVPVTAVTMRSGWATGPTALIGMWRVAGPRSCSVACRSSFAGIARLSMTMSNDADPPAGTVIDAGTWTISSGGAPSTESLHTESRVSTLCAVRRTVTVPGAAGGRYTLG